MTPEEILKDPIVLLAEDYATKAHEAIGQRRKYTGDSYIIHPRNVAVAFANAEIARHRHGIEGVAAAFLHDVVEDVVRHEKNSEAERNRRLAEMYDLFPPQTMQFVMEVTNIATAADGPRRVRAEINMRHIVSATPYSASIKYADINDNLENMIKNDREFSYVYFPEKAAVLTNANQGDRGLYLRAIAACLEGMQTLLPAASPRHRLPLQNGIKNLLDRQAALWAQHSF